MNIERICRAYAAALTAQYQSTYPGIQIKIKSERRNQKWKKK